MILLSGPLALHSLSRPLAIVSLLLVSATFVLVILSVHCRPAVLLLHVCVVLRCRRAASRSRPPVPGVAARTVRHGLLVQV